MSQNNLNAGCSGGHGNGGHGQQARHGGNHNHGSGNHPKAHSSQAKFQGACEVLKGHIFDCSDHHQADKYATTLKKLSKHIGAMFKNGGNVGASIVAKAKYAIPCLTAPTAPVNPGNPMAAEQMDQKLFNKWLDALKGHIFNCSDHHQVNRCATTLKKLSEHVRAMFKNGGNVWASIVAKAKYAIPHPTASTAPTNPGNPMAAEQMDQ